jgi:hypothetical protein
MQVRSKAARGSALAAVLAAAWVIGVGMGLPLSAAAQNAGVAAVQDRLGVPGPQQVAGQAHVLAFVTPPHPSGRVLQEYLPAGQALDSYTSMLLLDYAPGDAGAMAVASAKLAEIQARKANGDAVANGQMLQGQGDSVALDFILSAPLPGGGIVVEWNGYHYRRQGNGLLLTAWSRRAYGDAAVTAFLRELKDRHEQDLAALLRWQPVVSPR